MEQTSDKSKEPKDGTSTDWESGWADWVDFNAQHGNVEIPQDKPALADWVEEQRQSYKSFEAGKASGLDDEKINVMNKKNFKWSKATSVQPKSTETTNPTVRKTSPAKKKRAENSKRSLNKVAIVHDVEVMEKHDLMTSVPVVSANTKPRPTRRRKVSTSSSATPPNSKTATKKSKALSEISEAKAPEEDDSDRPVTPEMEKMSATFVADENEEAPLHCANFTYGDSDSYVDEEDTESDDEEWNSDRKLPAKKQKSPSATKKPSTPSFTKTTDTPSPGKGGGRYPRRATRRSLAQGDGFDEPDGKRQKIDDDDDDDSVDSSAAKPRKRDMRKYSLRMLKRLIPEEKEEEARQACRVEFAELLKSDEPLEADKKKGVDHQSARSNTAWEDNFLEYLVFQKVYGHGIVPKIFATNPYLGRWTVRNRRWWKSKDKRLTRSRIRRLKEANFVWEAKKDPSFWKVQQRTTQEDDKWESKFAMLVEYHKDFGHCMVPKEYAPNMVLARWVGEQRKQMKAKGEGRHSTLTDEREQRLRDIGFIFNTRTREHLRNAVLQRFQDRWNICFERLLKFKEIHGHAAVPRRFKADKDLASWAMRQRSHGKKYMRGEKNYLTTERFELLKSVDFIFEMDRYKYPLAGGLSRGAGHDSEEEEDAADGADSENGKGESTTKEDEVPLELVESKVVEEAVAAAVADHSAQIELEDKISDEVLLSIDAAVTPAEAYTSSTPGPEGPKEISSTMESREAFHAPPLVEENELESTRRTTRQSKTIDLVPKKESDKVVSSEEKLISSPSARLSLRPSSQVKKPPSTKKTNAESKTTTPSRKRKALSTATSDVDSMRTTRASKVIAEVRNAALAATLKEEDDCEREEVDERKPKEMVTNELEPPEGRADAGEVVKRTDTTNEKPADPGAIDVEIAATLQPSNEADGDKKSEKPSEDSAVKKKKVVADAIVEDGNYETDVEDDNNEKIPGTNDEAHEKLVEENNEKTQEEAETATAKTGEEAEELIGEKHEEEEEEAPPEPQRPTSEDLRKINEASILRDYKGVWLCELCELDEHLSYVSFLAHEARCARLQGIAVPVNLPLD